MLGVTFLSEVSEVGYFPNYYVEMESKDLPQHDTKDETEILEYLHDLDREFLDQGLTGYEKVEAVTKEFQKEFEDLRYQIRDAKTIQTKEEDSNVGTFLLSIVLGATIYLLNTYF